jgi:hypothetical protein
MDLLLTHNQKKVDSKSGSVSICDLKLFSDETNIEYIGTFDFDYQRYGAKRQVTFVHSFTLNIPTGDIVVNYKLLNNNLTKENQFKTSTQSKKNSFKMLSELSENGFYRGEKRLKYWGVKYERVIESINSIVLNKIKPHFKGEFIKSKNYENKYVINPLYDMVVDYHLDRNEIKQHDGVYEDIKYEYPKKKWLLKNDNKFLPSILDSYGIKSKYLIGELNKRSDKPIHIASLNYLCKLFGNNYIDYLKQFVWDIHCYDIIPNRKVHRLKNDAEKKSMVNLINRWEKDSLRSDSLIYNLNKLFTVRELLEQRGLELKFKAKDDNEFENLLETWNGIKMYLARGYKLKYTYPEDFVNIIESEIEIDGEIFTPKILLTEEDFRVEGYDMKNCMSKQFTNGNLYVYVSLTHKKKRINLQYRKGNLIQQYGKANTPVIDTFNLAVEALTNRFKSHPNIEWKKEKYEFLLP